MCRRSDIASADFGFATSTSQLTRALLYPALHYHRGRTSQIGLTHDRTRERDDTRVQSAAAGHVAPMARARAQLAPTVVHRRRARRPVAPDNVRRQPHAVWGAGCASHPVRAAARTRDLPEDSFGPRPLRGPGVA